MEYLEGVRMNATKKHIVRFTRWGEYGRAILYCPVYTLLHLINDATKIKLRYAAKTPHL